MNIHQTQSKEEIATKELYKKVRTDNIKMKKKYQLRSIQFKTRKIA